jgi:hypothetical protein
MKPKPKIWPRRCRTPRCRGRTHKTNHSPFCSKCASRRFAQKHPLKYAFKNLRNRAKQRGHAFQLTFEQYEKFARETGYAEQKGKTKYSLSIDRRDPSLGYRADNIRAVTLSLNSRYQYAGIPDYILAEIEAAEKQIRGGATQIGVLAE